MSRISASRSIESQAFWEGWNDMRVQMRDFAIIIFCVIILFQIGFVVNFPESYAGVVAKFVKAYNAEMLK